MAGVRDRWTDDGRRFMREIERLKQQRVCIGFQHGKDRDNKVDMADVAAWNEFGTVRSPSRPFMRNSIDNNMDKIKAFGAAQVRRIAAGATSRDVLNAMGAMQKGLMQHEITEGHFQANAPSTVRRKKSDRPLVDTGQMRQSIHFVIKPKGDD